LLAYDQIGWFNIGGKFELSRLSSWTLGIKAKNSAVNLIQQKNVAVVVNRQRLRACNFGVNAGVDDTYGVIAAATPELMNQAVCRVRRCWKQGGTSKEANASHPIQV
jgi:hypothetical protein